METKSDSWPYGQKGEENQNHSLILKLNDDCLEMIFKKLPRIDQINLACTCQRLRNVFILYSKVAYKTVRLSDNEYISEWQDHQFFKMAGSHIETLVLNRTYFIANNIFNCAAKFCNNVKILVIHAASLEARMFRNLIVNMTSITCLRLSDCNLQDSGIKCLGILHNLIALILEHNGSITGKAFCGIIECLRVCVYAF